MGEDASKQGRKINDIDADEDITLVIDQNDVEMFDVNDLHEVFVKKEFADKEVSVTGEVNAISNATTISVFKRAREEPIQKSIKKQKVEDDKETAELKQLMEIILDEKEVAIDAIPLAVKSSRIVD
nr:hypothetical protein [Tanacetum cinerariifolium]